MLSDAQSKYFSKHIGISIKLCLKLCLNKSNIIKKSDFDLELTNKKNDIIDY